MKMKTTVILLIVSLLVAWGKASTLESTENDVLGEKDRESMIQVKDGKEEQLNPNPNPKPPADENFQDGTIHGDDNPILDSGTMLKRQLAFPPGSANLWPNGVVPYVYGDRAKDYTYSDKAKFHKGVNRWSEVSCVKFVPYQSVAAVRRAGLKYWLDVGVGAGLCAAGGGVASPQITNLRKACLTSGTLAHEAGHVLGVQHTHIRDDRDYILRVKTKGLPDNVVHNFIKAEKSINPYPYDLQSIMHYGKSRYIQAKDQRLNFLMGSRGRLTHYDVKTMNYLYKCTDKCPAKRCENTGYVGVDCKCRCPDLLEGDRCERLSSTGISANDPACVDYDPKCQTSDKSYYQYWNGRCRRYTCIKACRMCDATVRPAPKCTKIINLADGQSLTISSPKNEYTRCLWLIKVNRGRGVRLTMNKFSTPNSVIRSHGRVCPHWLEVRYSLVDQQGPKFCGSGWPHGTIESSPMGDYNYMVLRYDAVDRQVKPQEGFEATVTSVRYPDCRMQFIKGVDQSADDGISTGKVLKMSCSKNYLYKSGGFKLHCQKDGTWAGTRMNCVASQCLDLKDGPSKLCPRYKMHQCGFSLSQKICPRTCCDIAVVAGTIKQCSRFRTINGWYRDPFKVRQRNAYILCRRGYYAITGNRIRTCKLDGTWSGKNPVCARVDAKDMFYLKLVFDMMDKNGNGVIDFEELRTINKRMGYQGLTERVTELMSMYDVNRRGSLSFLEVLPLIHTPYRKMMLNPAEMRKAFQEADANKNGSIDNGEVSKILRRTSRYYKIVSSQVSRLIATLDRSRDGKIQYSELRPYLCKYTSDNACGKEYY